MWFKFWYDILFSFFFTNIGRKVPNEENYTRDIEYPLWL